MAEPQTQAWVFVTGCKRVGLAALVGAVVAAASVHAGERFVAPNGDDAGPGTLDRPFRTIQKAAEAMAAGDTCIVREGVYRETVTLKNAGRPGQPIRFVAHPGEVATLCGTEPIDGPWQVYRGDIYTTKVNRDFVQLFVDGKMMVEARWPNMSLEQLLDRSRWARATRGSRYGKIRDPELAKTGIDWTGALATLNVTHQFYTWTRFVTAHAAGQDFFEYPKDFSKANEMRFAKKSWPWEDDRYYLSGKLAALDRPTEWFLDRDTRTLYLWTEDGASPAGRSVEAKARDLAFEANGLDYIHLEGLHFFGATFQFRECSHCTLDGCHLLFPTYARELTDLNAKRVNTVRTWMQGHYNTVRNCSLAFSSTVGVKMAGQQNVIENCLVHDVCWNGSLRYTAIQMSPYRRGNAPAGGIVRGNTVFNCGNAIISWGGQPYLIERNHVYDGGLACKDVALIYTGGPTCAGSVVRYNWAHGCRTEEGAGLGIRGDDQTRKLTVHHNVVWDCGRDGIIVKGDFNKVYNNTALYIGTKARLGNHIAMPVRPEPVKPWRRQHPLLQVQNANSEVFNNAARTIVGDQGRRTPFPPGRNLADNYSGEALKLVDPHRLDFRPRADSPLVDAGRQIPGFTDGHKGKAPDIGAYEYGGQHWKPGHRNGLWLSCAAPLPTQPTTLRFRVALTMPVLEPIAIDIGPQSEKTRVLSGARLQFGVHNWMRPQDVTLAGATQPPVAVAFRTKRWGEVRVADVRGEPAGIKVWFEQPDIGKIKPMDHRFNTDYFPDPRRPRRLVRPVARAFDTDEPPRIDGRLNSGEWPGWGPARRLLLRPLDDRDDRTDAAGEGYVLRDDNSLYVAFRIRGPLDKTGAGRGRWGQTDGVEVDLQPIFGNKVGPVFVLHGFPSGKMESAMDAGATDAQAKALGAAVDFAAHVGEGSWTAELRLPFAALATYTQRGQVAGLEPANIRLNLGARVGAVPQGEWFAWVKTGRANYAVDQAGDLALLPRCSASAENALRNGGFELQDLQPWRKANNSRTVYKAHKVGRVREAADGGWCVRIECSDAELMKQSVLKWLHPLAKDLAPGAYVLSYDLRVAKLEARDKSGMFCAYIRTSTGPKAGQNEGQMPYAFSGRDLPWTRRDCVIDIPQEAKLSFVSLQLHKATGTVWLDNVSLLRCK